MPTYFDKIKRNYKDVPITEEGISTEEFLEATEDLIGLFGI